MHVYCITTAEEYIFTFSSDEDQTNFITALKARSLGTDEAGKWISGTEFNAYMKKNSYIDTLEEQRLSHKQAYRGFARTGSNYISRAMSKVPEDTNTYEIDTTRITEIFYE